MQQVGGRVTVEGFYGLSLATHTTAPTTGAERSSAMLNYLAMQSVHRSAMRSTDPATARSGEEADALLGGLLVALFTLVLLALAVYGAYQGIGWLLS